MYRCLVMQLEYFVSNIDEALDRLMNSSSRNSTDIEKLAEILSEDMSYYAETVSKNSNTRTQILIFNFILKLKILKLNFEFESHFIP